MPDGTEPAAREGLSHRGKHWRLWVGLDGVVRVIIEGDHDEASAEDILDAFGDLAGKVPERPLRLLLYAHRTVRLTPDARERFTEACRAHPTVRVAVVRASPLARIQARAIARRSDTVFGFFESEHEALQSLGVPEAPPRAPEPRTPDVGLVDHTT